MNQPSDIARQAAGTFIEDQPPIGGTAAFLEKQLRNGVLRPYIDEVIKTQSTALQPDLVRVESVNHDKIVVVIPGRIRDHESPTTFVHELKIELDPLTGSSRLFA